MIWRNISFVGVFLGHFVTRWIYYEQIVMLPQCFYDSIKNGILTFNPDGRKRFALKILLLLNKQCLYLAVL